MDVFIGTLIVLIIVLVFLWFWIESQRDGHDVQKFLRRKYRNIKNKSKYAYDKVFTSPRELFQKTVGYENDETAALAMEKALAKEREFRKRAARGQKIDSYDAAENSFILANLYQFNIAQNGQSYEEWLVATEIAADYYDKAVKRIMANPTQAVQAPAGPDWEEIRARNDQLNPPEFIIDRAEDFYEEYLAEVRARNLGDPRPATIPFQPPDFNEVRETLRRARLEETQNRAAGRIFKAKATGNRAETPGDVFRAEYYEVKDVPNDPQNVHDTEVNDELQAIFRKVVEKNNYEPTTPDSPRSVEEVRQAIYAHRFEKSSDRDNALLIFEKMNNPHVISKYEMPERDILFSVWRRVNSPENKENQEGLRNAFMDALANSIDTNNYGVNKEVCANGRCSRVLNSLTLLDKDEDISRPIRTVEILRNEIFSKAHNIIQKELEKSPQDVADAYNGKIPEEGPLQEKVETFRNQLRENIAETVRTDYKATRPEVLENLIKDAQAGV